MLCAVRAIREGSGPNIVLMHTFSTEIGQFRNLAEQLSETHTVWAFDLPGFGYSDLPNADISAETYAEFAAAFLNYFEISGATVVGESIGGSLSLMLAADDGVSVARAIAINPIGYADGPLALANTVAAVFSTAMRTPVLSGFVARIRNINSTRLVMNCAVAQESSLTEAYVTDLNAILQRPEFSEAQRSFFRHGQSWVDATGRYGDIDVPATILWGEEDWSTSPERDAYAAEIGGAATQTIAGSGHFMTLDQPDAILQEVLGLTN